MAASAILEVLASLEWSRMLRELDIAAPLRWEMGAAEADIPYMYLTPANVQQMTQVLLKPRLKIHRVCWMKDSRVFYSEHILILG